MCVCIRNIRVSVNSWRTPFSYIIKDITVLTIFFLIFCIMMLWPVWPCWPQRDFPSEGWPVPRYSKGLTCVIFICKPINPESTPPLPPISGSHIQGHYFPVLITQRPGTKQLGTALMLQSLLKLFKLANPKPAYAASTIPSHGNHNKGSCPCFPLTPSTSWLTLI